MMTPEEERAFLNDMGTVFIKHSDPNVIRELREWVEGPGLQFKAEIDELARDILGLVRKNLELGLTPERNSRDAILMSMIALNIAVSKFCISDMVRYPLLATLMVNIAETLKTREERNGRVN